MDIDDFVRVAQDRNIIITPQRYALFSLLYHSTAHPTVHEIFSELKKKIPKATLATVYKNLALYIENGFVLEFSLLGERHYDLMAESHDHFICTVCNKIVDLPKSKVSKENKEPFGTIDFSTTLHIGVCRNCMNKENNL